MKKLLFFLFLLICSSFVYAIDSGEDIQIVNIVKCYGVIDIKLRGIINITNNEINFKECEQVNNDMWRCNCKQYNTPIILETKNYTRNIYDVIVEYYISPKVYVRPGEHDVNDDNRRTYRANNIKVVPETIKEKTFNFVLPELNITFIFIVAIIILIFTLGFIIYFVWTNINNIEEDSITGYMNKKRHIPKELKTGNKEIDDIIKNT